MVCFFNVVIITAFYTHLLPVWARYAIQLAIVALHFSLAWGGVEILIQNMWPFGIMKRQTLKLQWNL
jgi:cbb3-type cytochrome oxidase subunit 1